ncbi:MAG: hypothetical protein O3A46_15200 [Candidatus Poribacteria bacterium]|nr:hypothetical protein [Candidatus Poribacteria bacterium]
MRRFLIGAALIGGVTISMAFSTTNTAKAQGCVLLRQNAPLFCGLDEDLYLQQKRWREI